MIRQMKFITLAATLAAASALAATSAQAAGWIVGLVDGKSIVTIDPATRKVASKVDIKGAGAILGIDVRPADGMLYGVAGDGNIVTIDVKTGQATMKSKLSEAWKAGVTVTFDFNPVADRLRLMSSEGVNLRVNVDDGKVIVDGSHKFKDGDANAGKTPKIVAGAYTNSWKGTKATTLYNIDAATGALVTQAPPNDGVLNTIGSLGIKLERPGGVQHRGTRRRPQRRLARHRRRALFGRSQDRQGHHGRQDRGADRHADRHRLARLTPDIALTKPARGQARGPVPFRPSGVGRGLKGHPLTRSRHWGRGARPPCRPDQERPYEMSPQRRIGMLIFPRLTQLDMTGPYEVLARLPNTAVDLVAHTLDPVQTDRGMMIVPTATYATCQPLDVVMVPGGPGQQDLMEDAAVLEFLRQQASSAKYVTSVCTGSLVLGAAGLLKGKRATCHWAAIEHLALLGAIPVHERVVVDGNIVTGAGVASGIDFALTLAAILEGEQVAREIQLQIEYDPAPPFNSGSPRTASAGTIEALRARLAPLNEQRRTVARRVGERLGVPAR